MKRPSTLAARLFAAQMIVIVVASVALVLTILLVAPGLFLYHLEMTGEDSPAVQKHAQEAFEISVGIALLAAGSVAVLAAGLLSWFLARRVSQPIEDLARAAESVAHGNYDIEVPSADFGRELSTLASSFQGMAEELASTDAARAQLLADLAHEIRTPLATLEAHIDGLEDGILPSDSHNYDVMRSQVQRLQRLARDVKVVAAAQEHALDLQPRSIAVIDLVALACDLYAARYAEKGVELLNECADDDGRVLVDPDRMQQLLANLLDNAVRHTPPGGAVGVRCEHAADHILIHVEDTGTGIPADQMDAVFDRFHRVDDARGADGGGSGLGLTIARAIAEDHGGQLTASSRSPEQGTVVTISLPVASTGAGFGEARPPSHRPQHRPDSRVRR